MQYKTSALLPCQVNKSRVCSISPYHLFKSILWESSFYGHALLLITREIKWGTITVAEDIGCTTKSATARKRDLQIGRNKAVPSMVFLVYRNTWQNLTSIQQCRIFALVLSNGPYFKCFKMKEVRQLDDLIVNETIIVLRVIRNQAQQLQCCLT